MVRMTHEDYRDRKNFLRENSNYLREKMNYP